MSFPRDTDLANMSSEDIGVVEFLSSYSGLDEGIVVARVWTGSEEKSTALGKGAGASLAKELELVSSLCFLF